MARWPHPNSPNGEPVGLGYSDSANSNVVFTLDRLGRRTQVQVGTVGTASLAYDLAGNLLGESFSGGSLDGQIVTNLYDHPLRRPNLALLNAQPAVLAATIYGYDCASRLAAVSDGATRSFPLGGWVSRRKAKAG